MAQPNPKSSVKKVIAVVSGKGGVGKSSVTAMLATAKALAKEVYKNSDDIEKLKAALESLTKVSNEIFSKLYAQAGGNPGAGTEGNADNGSTDPNNFSDFTTK